MRNGVRMWLAAVVAVVSISLVAGCAASGVTGPSEGSGPETGVEADALASVPEASRGGFSTGTLEQAVSETGLQVTAPGWLPEGACLEEVTWRRQPQPMIQQVFILADGRYLVLTSFIGVAGATLDGWDGRRVSFDGIEGVLDHVPPEAGDTVSPGHTDLAWIADGLHFRLLLDGPPDEALMFAVAASVQ